MSRKDSLTLLAGLAGIEGLAQAPDLRVVFGGRSFVVASGDFTPKRNGTFAFRGPKGGLTNVDLNPNRERLVIRGAGLDLGEYADGPNPVVVTLSLGTDSRTIAVRMNKRRKVLVY